MKIELISGDFQVASDASARQTIAARTTARPQSPLGGLWLEIAALRRCPVTSLSVVEAGYRNKTRLRNFWTTALALFRGLFKTPSRQDQKLAPRLSVVFTATGPLVYRDNPLAAVGQSELRRIHVLDRRFYRLCHGVDLFGNEGSGHFPR